MKLSVKKGDNVIVITGKDKGKKGKIISADPSAGKVRVEDVNLASRHKKARSAKDTGGVVKVEGAIDVSNVQIICPTCGKRTRVGHTIGEKGKKVRQCKKCGASLDIKVEKVKKAAKKAAKKDKADQAEEPKTAKKAPAKKAPAKKAEKVETPVAEPVAEAADTQKE